MNSGLRLSARWLLAAGLRRSSREQTTQWTVDSSLYVRSSVIYICVLWRLTLKPPQYTKKRTHVWWMCTWMCTRAARVCRTRGLDCPCRSDGGGSLERTPSHSSQAVCVDVVVSRRREFLWSVCSVWTLIVSDSRTDTRRCKQTRGVGGWGGGGGGGGGTGTGWALS